MPNALPSADAKVPPGKRTTKRLNCWEFLNCQNFQCPAYSARKGRSCFMYVGSLSLNPCCPEIAEGRYPSCVECDFHRFLENEEAAFWSALRGMTQFSDRETGTIEALMDEVTVKRILRERAAALSQQIELDESTNTRKVVSFRLGNETFAVDLCAVTEVRKLGTYAAIPCAPSHVLGLISLRGSFLTLFDIRDFVGIIDSTIHPEACYVVTAQEIGVPAGILVDEIEGVLELDGRQVRLPLATLKGAAGLYVEGEVMIDDRQITVLDLKRLMSSERLVVDQEIENSE